MSKHMCDCRVDSLDGIVYCPLHKAAPELLAALHNFGHAALSQSDYCSICGGDVTRNMHASGCAVLVAEAAIRKAEGTL